MVEMGLDQILPDDLRPKQNQQTLICNTMFAEQGAWKPTIIIYISIPNIGSRIWETVFQYRDLYTEPTQNRNLVSPEILSPVFISKYLLGIEQVTSTNLSHSES